MEEIKHAQLLNFEDSLVGLKTAYLRLDNEGEKYMLF